MTHTRTTDQSVKKRRNGRRRDHTTPRTAAEALAEAAAWQLRAELMPDTDGKAIVAAFKKAAYWSGKAAAFAAREARQAATAAPVDAAMPPAADDPAQAAPDAPMTTMQGMNAIVSRRLRKGAKP